MLSYSAVHNVFKNFKPNSPTNHLRPPYSDNMHPSPANSSATICLYHGQRNIHISALECNTVILTHPAHRLLLRSIMHDILLRLYYRIV
jgi:hypothetical protein